MNKFFDKKELHLFIIWEKGRFKEKEILQSITENFELVEKYQINWDRKSFAKNLTTFYGTNLPPKSEKEKHVGKGEFLLITCYDNNPKYDFVKTSKGLQNVNLNVFNTKEKFRALTNGGHKIHATNSIFETNHDLTLLLGINYNDYEKSLKINLNNKKDDKIIKNIPNNIIGVNGWQSFEQLFYVMNSTLEYVVLRNFEHLPDYEFSKEHGDIDFLVKDIKEAIYIMNAEKLYKKKHKIIVAGKDILIDFEYIGDGSYDKNWQNEILKKRTIFKKCIYVPNFKNYFYSLIYHILIHKTFIAYDYPDKIKNIFKKLSFYDSTKCNFDHYLKLLENFLSLNNYQFCKPKDSSSFFDEKILNYKKDLENLTKLGLKNIEPCNVGEWKNFSGYIYFKADAKNNKKLFIKSRGIDESSKREYEVIKELRAIDSKYFPKEYYFKCNENIKFIAMEEINGQRLDNLIRSQKLKIKTKDFNENIYNGIFKILKILHKAKIVHRDIRPENFLIKEDGTPILIDFQFAVDIKREKYKEFKTIKKKPELIIGLGDKFAKNTFHWDDAYSVNKILNILNITNDLNFIEIKKLVLKINGKYEIISVQNNFFAKITILAKNFFLPYIYDLKLFFYRIIFKLISTDKFRNKIKKFEELKSKN